VKNFYYPLFSPDTMPEDSSDMLLDSTFSPHSPRQPSGKKKQSVTIEESMEVISELIWEIQSSETYPTDTSSPIETLTPPLSSLKSIKHSPMIISLATKSRLGSSSTSSLPQLKNFFHALLSTSQITITPIWNNSRISPIKATSQANELTSIGAKSFFKASKHHSGSVAGDFHIMPSLTFTELCSNVKISD